MDDHGDVTVVYSETGVLYGLRRLDGVWSDPVPIGPSDSGFRHPVVDSEGNAYIASSASVPNTLWVYRAEAGSSEWSEGVPVEPPLDSGLVSPVQARLGLSPDGDPMVTWRAHNADGTAILVTTCR